MTMTSPRPDHHRHHPPTRRSRTYGVARAGHPVDPAGPSRVVPPFILGGLGVIFGIIGLTKAGQERRTRDSRIAGLPHAVRSGFVAAIAFIALVVTHRRRGHPLQLHDQPGRASTRRSLSAPSLPILPTRSLALRRVLATSLAMCARATALSVPRRSRSAHAPGGFGVQCGFTQARRWTIPSSTRASPACFTCTPSTATRAPMRRFDPQEAPGPAGTTCTDKKDKAAIWPPTAFIRKNPLWRALEPRSRAHVLLPARPASRSHPSRACHPTSS